MKFLVMMMVLFGHAVIQFDLGNVVTSRKKIIYYQNFVKLQHAIYLFLFLKKIVKLTFEVIGDKYSSDIQFNLFILISIFLEFLTLLIDRYEKQ